MRTWLSFAALLGFLSVALGAFAAHGIADPLAQGWMRTGAQYGLRGLIRARDRDFAARMRLHARDALRVTGPGLRELADDWNRAHADS